MEVKDLPIDQIVVSEFNTRKDLDAGMEDSSIDDLAASIREKGLLSPIMVRAAAAGKYELIVGQRRFLACRKLGMTRIPAFVRSEIDDTDATAISLIENVHRAEMNAIDKARALAALRDKYGGDVHRVSKETGIGIQTVKRYLTLLGLPDIIQAKISTADGPARIDALSLLTRTFTNPDEMLKAYNKTAGFSQEIQKQIFKASGGDVSRIDSLVLQAQEGAFDTKICHGLKGRLMCQYIPEQLADAVIQLVEKYQKEQGVDLRDLARRLKA